MNTDGPLTFMGLIKFLQYIKGPDHWHEVGATGEPAFANSWVNYGGAMQVARFRKDADGVVYIEGVVKDGTIGSHAIFTLPEGYRPGDAVNLPTASNNTFGMIGITASTGNVNGSVGNNTWFSLNCSFYVG